MTNDTPVLTSSVDPASSFKMTSATMDDDAYLLAMVEGTGDDGTESSLLPSVMNFSGFLDDATQLNEEELSDIAGLLAPPVSDDDEEQAVSATTTEVAPMNKPTTKEPVYVSSSEASTPTGDRSPTLLATAQAVIDNTEIPTLPELTKSIAAVSNKVTLAPKRLLAAGSTAIANSNKKAKIEPSSAEVEISNPVLPVPSETPELVPSSSSTAVASDKPTMTAEACTSTSVSPTTVVSSSTTSPSVPKQTITAEEAAAEAKTKAITEQATAAAAAASNTPAQVTLSEEARAQQCRDRNRQHARNTRLRKKAYIEELKRNLRDMVDQRDRELQAESHKALVEKQQREVRFQVMQDFLQLRGRNEANPHRWAAILTDGFTLTLPVTRFQDMVATASAADNNSSQPPREQVLTGVDQIMQDSTYFAAFLQSLGNTNTTTPTSTNDDTHVDTNNMATTTTFTYHCHRSNFLMDGCTSILSWTATSNGATSKGASSELEMAGSMRATFCPQTNRLAKVDIQFDTGVAHKQIGH